MAVLAKTFYVDSIRSGPLDAVTYFLANELGVEGDNIIDLQAVRTFEGTVQLTVLYKDRSDDPVLAAFPPPGSILRSTHKPSHISVLFSSPLDSSVINWNNFNFNNNIEEIVGEADVESGGHGHIVTLKLPDGAVEDTSYNFININSSILKYKSGDPIQYSSVVEFSSESVTAHRSGQEIPYTAKLGRRGEVSVEGFILEKKVLPSDRISEFLLEKGIDDNRLINYASVDLSNGRVYVFFAYFSTLEPQLMRAYPYNYGLSLYSNKPDNIVLSFRDPLDKNYVENTEGLFRFVESADTIVNIVAGQVSVSSDGKTVTIPLSAITSSEGNPNLELYDLRIVNLRSADGTKQTRDILYCFQTTNIDVVGSASGTVKVAGAGLVMGDPPDNTVINITAANSSITVNEDSIQVGTIGASNISAGQVVKSITAGATTIRDAVTISASGPIDASIVGSAVTFSFDDTGFTKTDGSRAFTSTIAGVAPTLDSHLATKGYVDDAVEAVVAGVSSVNSLAGSVSITAGNAINVTTTTSIEIAVDESSISHSNLANLSADDHPQYSRIDGSRSFTSVVGGVTPTLSSHLATKGYVDSNTVTSLNSIQGGVSILQGSLITVSTVGTNITISVNESSIDHGSIAGLGHDDHPQYILADGSRNFSSVVGGVTPTLSNHLATKGYVDTEISSYTTDHGSLEGLEDDDHPQYILADSSRPFESLISLSSDSNYRALDTYDDLTLTTKYYLDNQTITSLSTPESWDFVGEEGNLTGKAISGTAILSGYGIGVFLLPYTGTGTGQSVIKIFPKTQDTTLENNEYGLRVLYHNIPHSGLAGNATSDDHSQYAHISPTGTRNTISNDFGGTPLRIVDSLIPEDNSNLLYVYQTPSTPYFSVTASGNVGIGIDNPEEKLVVVGNANFSGGSISNIGGITPIEDLDRNLGSESNRFYKTYTKVIDPGDNDLTLIADGLIVKSATDQEYSHFYSNNDLSKFGGDGKVNRNNYFYSSLSGRYLNIFTAGSYTELKNYNGTFYITTTESTNSIVNRVGSDTKFTITNTYVSFDNISTAYFNNINLNDVGHVIPSGDKQKNLGSDTNRFTTVYTQNINNLTDAIYIRSASIFLYDSDTDRVYGSFNDGSFDFGRDGLNNNFLNIYSQNSGQKIRLYTADSYHMMVSENAPLYLDTTSGNSLYLRTSNTERLNIYNTAITFNNLNYVGFNNIRLADVKYPTFTGDGANKKYVDDQIGSLSLTVSTHTENNDNPHNVTYNQVGAEPEYRSYNVGDSLYKKSEITGRSIHASLVTGAIKITLPTNYNSCMMSFVVEGYNYNTTSSYRIDLGGYNYSSNENWYRTTCKVSRAPHISKEVRYGSDGEKCIIVIGSTGDVHSCPKLTIRDYLGSSIDIATGSWDINISSDIEFSGNIKTGLYSDYVISESPGNLRLTLDGYNSDTYIHSSDPDKYIKIQSYDSYAQIIGVGNDLVFDADSSGCGVLFQVANSSKQYIENNRITFLNLSQIDVSQIPIVDLPTPTIDSEAANKLYVDNQISTLSGYSLSGLSVHVDDNSIHFTESSIDHNNIQNKGTHTHSEIDSHIGDSSIHFTENSIDHGSISGLSDDDHIQYVPVNASRGFTSPVSGEDPTSDYHLSTKSYVDSTSGALSSSISSHTNDSSIHFTESSIDHGSIAGLSDDDHSQYIHNNPNNSGRNVIDNSNGYGLYINDSVIAGADIPVFEITQTPGIQKAYIDGEGNISGNEGIFNKLITDYVPTSDVHVINKAYLDDLNRLAVEDTRGLTIPPTSYNNEVKFEFKPYYALTDSTDGNGPQIDNVYGGLVTIAPWGDDTGGPHTQLYFSKYNNKPAFYIRYGMPNNGTTWEPWTRVVTENHYDISPPSGLQFEETDDYIRLTFSGDASYDAYEIYSAVGSATGFGLIGIIPPDEVAETMSINDNTATTKGAIYYRLYGKKYGAYSNPVTQSYMITGTVDEVSDLQTTVIGETAYHIQYKLPTSRFLEKVQIKVDSNSNPDLISEDGASLIYEGLSESYMYVVPDSDIGKYHQFFVYTIERT